MAEKYAVVNGNWSDPATWNDGTLPGNADDVYANGKTVTIDIDLVGTYSVLSIRTTAGTTAVAGGNFQVTTSRTIEFVASGTGIQAGTSTCLTLSHAYPAEVIIRWATGGSGVIVRGGSTSYAYGIRNYSTGSVTVTGNVTGGSGSNAFGISNYSTGSVTVTGDCYAGSAYALYNAAGGTIDVYGSLNPSPTYNADVAAGANSTSGKIIFSTLKADTTNHRWPGVIGRCFIRDTSSYLQIYDKDELQVTYIDNSSVNNPPAESDVRYGVTYTLGGARTGTCHVPAPDSVAYGVPVDNTTGTAVLKMADAAAAVWNELRSSHTTPGTFGAVSEWAGGGSGSADWTDTEKNQIRYRLGIDGTTGAPVSGTPHLGSTYSTLDDIGAAVNTRLASAAYTAPDNASIASIKATVDTNLDAPVSSRAPASTALSNLTWTDTKAGYLDAAVSSRLAGSAYTAPDNANISAIKAAIDQYLDVAISSRMAGSSYVAPDNTSISAIKAAIDQYLDAAISSRLPTASYVAPDNAGVAAIKTQTDKLQFDASNYVYATGLGGGGSVQVVVQPLSATVQQTAGDGGTITFWLHARAAASWVIRDVDLTGHGLYLIIYDSRIPGTAIATFSTVSGEVTITYNSTEGYSLVQVDGSDSKLSTPGDYDYVLRDASSDSVLLSGRCIVRSAPDVS